MLLYSLTKVACERCRDSSIACQRPELSGNRRFADARPHPGLTAWNQHGACGAKVLAIFLSAIPFRLLGRASLRLDPAFSKHTRRFTAEPGIAVIFILI